MPNPHFDDNRVVWSDAYSGLYSPPPPDQFELQWTLALEGREGYQDTPGAGLDDAHIDDRIYTWTGQGTGFHDPRCSQRVLDHPVDLALIRGKRCADVGCGPGRWTKALQRMGAASVLSTDLAEHAIQSVSRFNPHVLRADVMVLDKEHPELTGQFEFVNLWGVAHHTYDPARAFRNAAALLGPHGALYLMVYKPGSMHDNPLTLTQRRIFWKRPTLDGKLDFVEAVYHRRMNWRYTLKQNLDLFLANLTGQPKGVKLGVLDMLQAYYNWVIPWDAITGWMKKAGFTKVIHLNEFEPLQQACAFHVLGIKK